MATIANGVVASNNQAIAAAQLVSIEKAATKLSNHLWKTGISFIVALAKTSAGMVIIRALIDNTIEERSPFAGRRLFFVARACVNKRLALGDVCGDMGDALASAVTSDNVGSA